VGVEQFGRNSKEWLQKYLPLSKGIPSHDTIARLFISLPLEQVQTVYRDFVALFEFNQASNQLCIDGKTLRGSGDGLAQKKALHVVSAYDVGLQSAVAQVVCPEKSNEITAVKELLARMDFKDKILSLDAISCQRDIAKAICEGEGNYLLSLKNNQEALFEQAQKLFEGRIRSESFQELDSGHGRIENRDYKLITDFRFLDIDKEWPSLAGIICVKRTRIIKKTGKESIETSYYITSAKLPLEQLAQHIRAHWAVENKLHWVLDTQFNEDKSARRKGNSATAFNLLAKMVIALCQYNKPQKTSLRIFRSILAQSAEFREELRCF